MNSFLKQNNSLLLFWFRLKLELNACSSAPIMLEAPLRTGRTIKTISGGTYLWDDLAPKFYPVLSSFSAFFEVLPFFGPPGWRISGAFIHGGPDASENGNYFQILDRISAIFLILFSSFLIPDFQAPYRIVAIFLILFLCKMIQKYEVTGGVVEIFKKEPFVFDIGGLG